MAIGTAAAILGAAFIGGGASALASAKASKTAKSASDYAADQNAEVNREIYTQTRSDLAPYNQAGQSSLSALMVRLGLAPQGGAAPAMNPGGTAPAKTAGGPAGTSPLEASAMPATQVAPAQPQANTQAYLQQWPDVAQEFQRLQATPEGQAQLQSIGATTPDAFADYHYQTFGQQAGREMPTTGAAPPAGQPAADPAQYYEETYAPRPDAVQVPKYGSAPTFSMDYNQIANDPGFQFETGETAKGVNANAAARGGLRSGDAAKALQDRLFGVAHTYGQDYFNRGLATFDRNYQGFIDDRSYGTNLALQDRNRQDNIFSEDRGFQAGRNDQQTSNLFGLAGIGQNAAAGTANAGNVFASNQIASNNQRANTTANAAIANAGNMTNLFGSAANAVGTYYGMQGGGGGSLPRTYSI